MIGDFFVVWCKFKNWQWHHLQTKHCSSSRWRSDWSSEFLSAHTCKSPAGLQRIWFNSKRKRFNVCVKSLRSKHIGIVTSRYSEVFPQKTDWYLYNLVFIIRHLGILKWNQRPSCALKNHLLSRWFRSPIVGLAWWEVRNWWTIGMYFHSDKPINQPTILGM